MGALLYGTQLMWLFYLTEKWTGSSALALGPMAFAICLGALYFGLLALGLATAFRLKLFWLVPILYAGHEVIRSFIPGLAFPWILVSTPLWPYPSLIQTAFFGTQFFVSAWVVLINTLMTMYLMGERWKPARPLILATGLSLAVSFAWYSREVIGDQHVIMVAQPGVDLAFGTPAEKMQLPVNVESLLETASLNNIKLVVLPEGIANGGATLPPATAFRVPKELNVIFGGRRGIGPVYQSAFAHEVGGTWSAADKKRLVVFGEYVPGRDFLPFLDKFNLPSGDLSASDKTVALDVGGIRVGPLLCFEGLFWDVAHAQAQNGSQLLAAMAIDDWYFGTPATDQLRSAAIWRAVETGLPVARSASLGISLAVDAHGNVLGELPPKRKGGMKVGIVIPKNPTPNPSRPVFPWLAFLSWPAFYVYLKFRQNQA